MLRPTPACAAVICSLPFVVLVACRPHPPVDPSAVDAALAAWEADSNAPTEGPVVERIWTTFDSSALAQLNEGRSPNEIQDWLHGVHGYAAAGTGDCTRPTREIVTCKDLPRLGDSYAFGALLEGKDPPMVLLVHTPGVNGPSHLSSFARDAAGWHRILTYSSEDQIDAQIYHVTPDSALVGGLETYVRADGSQSRPFLITVGRNSARRLTVEDTALLQDGALGPGGPDVAMEGCQFPRAIMGAVLGPRACERWTLSAEGDRVVKRVESTTPWIAVVDSFYLLLGRGDTRTAQSLVSPSARWLLTWARAASAQGDSGNAAEGWGWVELSTDRGERRVRVSRDAEGRWRIAGLEQVRSPES